MNSTRAMLDHMSFEELRKAYNDAPKPNAYGAEMLRRIHATDREAFGMNPQLLKGGVRVIGAGRGVAAPLPWAKQAEHISEGCE